MNQLVSVYALILLRQLIAVAPDMVPFFGKIERLEISGHNLHFPVEISDGMSCKIAAGRGARWTAATAAATTATTEYVSKRPRSAPVSRRPAIPSRATVAK